MNIEPYEPERMPPVYFDAIEVGEYFITEEDESEIWTEDSGDVTARIFKKLDINATNRFEAFDITDRSGEVPFVNFNRNDKVFPVEIKTLAIRIDWRRREQQ